MKKYIVILAAVISIFSFATVSFADDNSLITNQQFAYMAFNLLGLKAPDNMASLSAAESYEVMANMLSEKGINNFAGLDPNGSVTCQAMVDVLYALLGKTGLTPEAKLTYLVDNGIMTTCPLGDNMTLGQVNAILSNPVFASLVAEAYSAPASDTERTVADNVTGVVVEEPATQI